MMSIGKAIVRAGYTKNEYLSGRAFRWNLPEDTVLMHLSKKEDVDAVMLQSKQASEESGKAEQEKSREEGVRRSVLIKDVEPMQHGGGSDALELLKQSSDTSNADAGTNGLEVKKEALKDGNE